VLHPKERRLCITDAHRGTRGTLDEFKAAWGRRIAHDGDLPKILGGNLVPAAVANRRIDLQPYALHERGWLVCNLAYLIDRHGVLQAVHARPAERDQAYAGAPCSLAQAWPLFRSYAQEYRRGTVPCHKGTVKVL